MVPNVEPQTLVETFDRANYNSIPEYNVAIKALLTYLMFVLPHAHLSSKRESFCKGLIKWNYMSQAGSICGELTTLLPHGSLIVM